MDHLESRISKLELAAKRALFAERVPKPVFFDTAFNYIDLPMDRLLARAEKAEPPSATEAVVEKASEAVAGAAPVVATAAEKVVESPKKAIEAVQRSARVTRESMPAAEEGKGKPGQKGWLGGWFGRG
jgi:signal recognition particle subunit SRP68